MAAPVESKVQAGTGAAAMSGLALWALGNYVFKGSVPDVIVSWVYVLVPAALTFAAGYLAKHTPRASAPPVITVNAAAAPAEVAMQVNEALRRHAKNEPPPEKTLMQPPAAPE